MRKVTKILAVAAAALFAVGVQHSAKAAFIGAPMGLRGAIQSIKFEQPTLPPMAFTLFCLKYEHQGRTQETRDAARKKCSQSAFRASRLMARGQHPSSALNLAPEISEMEAETIATTRAR